MGPHHTKDEKLEVKTQKMEKTWKTSYRLDCRTTFVALLSYLHETVEKTKTA